MLLELLAAEVTQNEVLLYTKEKGYLARGRSLICFLPLGKIDPVPSPVRDCHITLTVTVNDKGAEKLGLRSLSQQLAVTVFQGGLRFL